MAGHNEREMTLQLVRAERRLDVSLEVVGGFSSSSRVARMRASFSCKPDNGACWDFGKSCHCLQIVYEVFAHEILTTYSSKVLSSLFPSFFRL
jgi:hypothetical protein